MFVQHSVGDTNRGASAPLPREANITRTDSTASALASRSSPLKFFASTTRQQHAAANEPANDLPARVDPVKEREPGSNSKRWTMDYLAELRKPVAARPLGARPLPGRSSIGSLDLPPRASSSLSAHGKERSPDRVQQLNRFMSPLGSQNSQPSLSRNWDAGRPLAREPDISIMEDIAKTTTDMDQVTVDLDGRKSLMPYYERGQRWMEKQEAKSLRVAMEYMDLEEEKRVHSAAQEEAADLVWKHKFADKPYENHEAFKKSIKDHLREGSHARSQSIGPFQTLYVTKNGAMDGKRSASDGSNSNKSESSQKARSDRVVSTSSKSSGDSSSSNNISSGNRRNRSINLKQSAGRILGSIRHGHSSTRTSNDRRSGLFSNPDDRIFEEPDSVEETPMEQREVHSIRNGPLSPKSRNASGTYRSPDPKADVLDKKSHATTATSKLSSVDIHRNPPSQSRDPAYTRNSATPPQAADVLPDQPLYKNGIEIRSDEIRAATSRRLKDRSESLPTPAFVSDAPDRPIVSFETSWKSKEHSSSSSTASHRDRTLAGARPQPTRPSVPTSTALEPTLMSASRTLSKAKVSNGQIDDPLIKMPLEGSQTISQHYSPLASPATVEIPQINVEVAQAVPEIRLPGDAGGPSIIPCIQVQGAEEPANPSQTSAGVPPVRTTPISKPVLRGHWSPAVSRVGAAACCDCGLHIQGRTLSAAGQRFHPECFNCFQCGTNLEHVAFYPEPDNAREERRSAGSEQFESELDQRFFCHLDFHELYSPRCKSCKTPIEGEVILACGGQWHQGHFFCAQCGDPFDNNTPFIEKDGWAWCIGCYKGRYSGKCRGCKKPVTEDGVSALGAEWHAHCFRCQECDGPFEDGKFFTRGAGEGPVCVKCETRRLKA